MEEFEGDKAMSNTMLSTHAFKIVSYELRCLDSLEDFEEIDGIEDVLIEQTHRPRPAQDQDYRDLIR